MESRQMTLEELTRRMAYRARGIDPLSGAQRRSLEIARYAKIRRWEIDEERHRRGPIRRAIEGLIGYWTIRSAEKAARLEAEEARR